MKNSVQLRWIEEAEARSVRELALTQRAESEPSLGVASSRAVPTWFARVRRMAPPPGRAAAVLLPFPGSTPAARRVPAEVDADRVLVTLLITDIVGSTKRVAEMGDRSWGVLLDQHDNATRHQIKRFGGREIRNRGDGFLALFDSPARAVRCAAAIGEAIAPLGISVRSGIHTGEIQLKHDEVSGIAVHIAARIAAAARPGEAFVSSTVRDLVAGSGLVFEDRGVHLLRGVPGQMHLYAMRAAVETTDASVISLRHRKTS